MILDEEFPKELPKFETFGVDLGDGKDTIAEKLGASKDGIKELAYLGRGRWFETDVHERIFKVRYHFLFSCCLVLLFKPSQGRPDWQIASSIGGVQHVSKNAKNWRGRLQVRGGKVSLPAAQPGNVRRLMNYPTQSNQFTPRVRLK